MVSYMPTGTSMLCAWWRHIIYFSVNQFSAFSIRQCVNIFNSKYFFFFQCIHDFTCFLGILYIIQSQITRIESISLVLSFAFEIPWAFDGAHWLQAHDDCLPLQFIRCLLKKTIERQSLVVSLNERGL